MVLALASQRFGRLVAVERAERGLGGFRWRCRCDCGNEVLVLAAKLRSGHTRSCGCLKNEIAGGRTRTHGRSKTAEWNVWCGMRQRCDDANTQQYRYYGGRGITVCPEWASFERFYADMGPRPSPAYSLDRIDNDGPYSPDNCRWVIRVDQRRNRSDSVTVIHEGRTISLVDWSRSSGTKYKTLLYRLHAGWPVEQVLYGRRAS